MDKDLIRGAILVFLTCISFASLVSSNENTGTCCSDGLGLNYTLPMFNECKKELHYNGSMVQTIPKLIPYTSTEAACPRRKSKLGIPPGHRVCRFPDCSENTCLNGRCEETMKHFKCHCSAGYRGKRCNKQSTTTQYTTMMSSTESTTSHSTTTTQSTTTQDTATMSPTESTASHPSTTTQSSTTQDTTMMSTTEYTTSHPTLTHSNWKCTSSKCYYLAEGTRFWLQAKKLCTNLNSMTTEAGENGPSLLFVENVPDFEKIEVLFSLSTKVWINCSYISFEKDGPVNLFCDVDGTGYDHTQDHEDNWDDGEPSGDRLRNCVAVDLVSGKWEDSLCNNTYHTVCQILL